MVSRYHDYKGVALLTKILGSIPSHLQLSALSRTRLSDRTGSSNFPSNLRTERRSSITPNIYIKNGAIARAYFNENKKINRIVVICTGVENLVLSALARGFDFFENP